MNVTSYLPDELVRAIDRLAHEHRSSRSAVIREALEAYLSRFRPGAWPEDILGWMGDAEFPPFESHRSSEQLGARDPFDGTGPS